MVVRNLFDEIIDVVKAEWPDHIDSRFSISVKRVEGVDPSQKNGYAFRGPWVEKGTVEVKPEPALFLTITSYGSRRYHDKYYHFVKMHQDGRLELLPFWESTKFGKGWALRVRDKVLQELLNLEAEAPQRPEWFPVEVWEHLPMDCRLAVVTAEEVSRE